MYGLGQFLWVFFLGTLYEFWTNYADSVKLAVWWQLCWPYVITLLTGMFQVWYMIIVGFIIGLIIHLKDINPWRDYNTGNGIIGYMFSLGLPFVSPMPIAVWCKSQ